jgi:peptidyl-prolyl cis-trans isomerase C
MADPTIELPEGADASLMIGLEVLENLIARQVAITEAMRLGYGPDESEVDATMERLIESSGSRSEFEMTLASFGMTQEDLRRQIFETMAVTNWRDLGFLAEVRVSEAEARAFYDDNIELAKHPGQVRALQIMLPVPMAAGAEAEENRAKVKAKAEAILKEAQEGADFYRLIELSMDQATRAAIDNGRLGWVSKETTGFPELEEVLFALKPGEVGGPVETSFSFHIVKVLETRPAGVQPFEELKSEIVEYLTDNNINIAISKKIAELRKSAQVEILDPLLAAAWPEFQQKLASTAPPEAGAPEPAGPTESTEPTEPTAPTTPGEANLAPSSSPTTLGSPEAAPGEKPLAAPEAAPGESPQAAPDAAPGQSPQAPAASQKSE